MGNDLAVSLLRGAAASAILASCLHAQVASNSSTPPSLEPAFVVPPPSSAGGCLTGFVGDTTLAGGWGAFESAAGQTMDVLVSGVPDFAAIQSIPWVGGGPLLLSPDHTKCTVGVSWGTWSHGYAGEVFDTLGATSATLTMPAGASAFDCYIEPGPFAVHTFFITGTATDSSTVTVNVTADGLGGASHFGFYTSGNCCLSSVTITALVSWAIGELRLGSCEVCPVGPNSSGNPALMSFSGSLSIAVNNFTVSALELPHNQYYIFFFGPNQQEIPFGNGYLCIAAPIARLNPPVQSSGAGLASRLVDISSFAPGTMNFQCWFRDPPAGGAAFDTSDRLEVVFVP